MKAMIINRSKTKTKKTIMKNIIIIISVLFASFSTNAQTKSEKIKNPGMANIQTSAQCGSCKSRIENKLNYTKGIRFAELDLETKKVLVKFSPKKITLSEVKKVISELGYQADNVKANHKSMKALPKCCQPGGHDK